MPPAISDNEDSASDGEAIPFKKAPAKNDVEDEEMQEAETNGDDAGEDDEGEPDEYVVEKILGHAFDPDGTLRYQIKWLGYEKKSDQTWEPEANLEGAYDILEAYHKKIGGRPTAPQKADKKRKSLASQSASNTPNETKTSGGRGRKKAKVEDESGSATPDVAGSVSGRKKGGMPEKWQPPKGSWEDEIEKVDTVEEILNPKTNEKERYVYIVWVSGRKTQHPLKVVNQKCPQKMLAYYEEHLVFKNNFTDPTDPPVKGDS